MVDGIGGDWRSMRPDDLAAISAISDVVHGKYSEDVSVYAERLSLYPRGCLVFVAQGSIAGYLSSHPWPSGRLPKLGEMLGALPAGADTYYLHDIALLPATRGHGAGRQATKLVTSLARAGGFRHVTLIAIEGADSFWASQGFCDVPGSVDPAYGAEARLMRRPI